MVEKNEQEEMKLDADAGSTPGARASGPLIYNGEVITSKEEMLSLTDMWKAAGSPQDRRPDDWKKDSANVAFIDHVAEFLNAPTTGIWTGKRGRNGGTWAHWQISIAYAKYLSHEFHMWANSVIRDRMKETARPLLAPPVDPDVIAKAAASAAGGAAKKSVDLKMAALDHHVADEFSGVRKEISSLQNRLTDMARWFQGVRREQIDMMSILSDPATRARIEVAIEDHIEMGGVYALAGIDPKGRIQARAILTNNITRSLDGYCRDARILGGALNVKGRKVPTWPKKAVADWLVDRGHALIARHMRSTGSIVTLHEIQQKGKAQ